MAQEDEFNIVDSCAWEVDGYSDADDEGGNSPRRRDHVRPWERSPDTGSDTDEEVDVDNLDLMDSDSDEAEPDPLTDPDVAAEVFVDVLLGLYVQSSIS